MIEEIPNEVVVANVWVVGGILLHQLFSPLAGRGAFLVAIIWAIIAFLRLLENGEEND